MRKLQQRSEDDLAAIVSALPWPIGPKFETEPPLPGSEPRESPPAVPEFGEGPCGRAATRLWDEHLNDPFARVLGPSLGHYQYIQERAERCRGISHPTFSGPCAQDAAEVFAYAWVLGDSPEEAERRARLAQRVCAAIREPLLDVRRDIGLGGP